MQIVFFLGLIVFAGTGGEIFVSRAMKQIGEVHDFRPRSLLRVMGRAFSSATMWTGISLMTVSFFALLALLSWRNVSFVVPATALNYALGALGGHYLLGEHVSAKRWLGVALVCLGVVFVVIG
jgi:drug/metabolite transporter (DMT)-like permease